MTDSEVRTVRSFCRICTAVCGILVDVSGDDVLRVRGDPDHPFSHGYTCPKGRALPRMHHHPERLERPLMRVDGGLQPTTWDECLDDLAARLRAVIASSGPEAIGVFFGSGVGMDAAGYRMAEKLYAVLGTRARFSPLTIDGTAKVLVSTLVGGFPGLNPHVDAEHADLVMYVGVNPVVSHGHTSALPDPVTKLRALRARAEVWVVDPRRTETARLATHHLAPRPGADYAVLAFLVRDLLHDGADRDLVTASHRRQRHTRRRGGAVHARARGTRRRRRGVRAHATARRGAPRRVRGGRHGDRGHDVGRGERDAVARLGADDPHRCDEQTGRRVVPPWVRQPARGVRAPGVAARSAVRSARCSISAAIS